MASGFCKINLRKTSYKFHAWCNNSGVFVIFYLITSCVLCFRCNLFNCLESPTSKNKMYCTLKHTLLFSIIFVPQLPFCCNKYLATFASVQFYVRQMLVIFHYFCHISTVVDMSTQIWIKVSNIIFHGNTFSDFRFVSWPEKDGRTDGLTAEDFPMVRKGS
jgi:hypothetical protein